MTQEYLYNDEHTFMEKLLEVAAHRQPGEKIKTYTPLPVHGIEEVLKEPVTLVRVFAMVGAVAGILTAFWLTIFSSQRFGILAIAGQQAGIVVGGKSAISFLAYCVIAFELAVLFGSLLSFAGFLLFSKLPNAIRILDPIDYGNQWAIVVHRED